MSHHRRPPHDEMFPTAIGMILPRPEARGCFADEIAIDFPSMDAVVERMRAGLLGADENRASHNAAISVSPTDAWTGVTVPLDVPLRGTCGACGGRGETWAEPCVSCAGSGERSTSHQVRVAVPPRVADGTRLRFLVAHPYGVPTRVELTVLVS